MKVGNQEYRTIWIDHEAKKVCFIDQTLLPFNFEIKSTDCTTDLITAIETMQVRGAPVIGICGALALVLALKNNASSDHIIHMAKKIIQARPTAVNLFWAVNRVQESLLSQAEDKREQFAWHYVSELMEDDIRKNYQIGINGNTLIPQGKEKPFNILTHCNAGWLATVDHGTALSPIFLAHHEGKNIHIWVDETRPRNQGLLTAWELQQYDIPHTLIVDNAGGALMMNHQVDLVIVGADRISINGHVCNKVGTYLKALAAKAHNIPFYVAAPLATIDHHFKEEVNFAIEDRDPKEITRIYGLSDEGSLVHVNYPQVKVVNPAFDITPKELISGIITEKGVFKPDELKAIYE
jgi:methylthioribose-1-phosphate isomerase